MSRINTRTVAAARPAPLITTTTTRPNTRTHEGAPAYTRDAKGELFLTATTTFFGENTFYEKANTRTERLIDLAHQVAIDDLPWLTRFTTWLRNTANIRTAAIVIAAEGVKARLDAGQKDLVCEGGRTCRQCWTSHSTVLKAEGTYGEHFTNRRLINAALVRADEPGELLAYWVSRYGRPIPISVKRALADGAKKLYTEFNYLKWDSEARAVRMADVIDMTQPAYHHPEIRSTYQYDLFGYALAKRHNRDQIVISDRLPMIRERVKLMAVPVTERRALILSPDGQQWLKAAGMTWESLAGWLQGPMDAAAWEAMIPTMGYMALLRNLRNFDQAGVSDAVAHKVRVRLSDPEQVAKSRQLPYRFLSAQLNTETYRWSPAIEAALNHSVRNIPAFPGRTLVLVDTSASMQSLVSDKSKMSHVMTAALFGTALAIKGNNVDLVGFADGVFTHEVKRGSSVLREVERFIKRIGEVGHGTQLFNSVAQTYKGHDRVIAITDMQTCRYMTPSSYYSSYYSGYNNRHDASRLAGFKLPDGIPFYGFNTGGYKETVMDGKPGMYELGGMTDSTFAQILNIEAAKKGVWPWEQNEQVAA
jgi:hypothetical protein